MRDQFRLQLDDLNSSLAVMADDVARAMASAGDALLNQDLHTAEQVIAGEATTVALRTRLDQLVIELLVLQAPVASDMRLVLTALRATSALERMRVLATHVAKLVRLRFPDPVVPDDLVTTVQPMVDASNRLASKGLRLLSTHDSALVETIRAEEVRLDAMYKSLINKLGSSRLQMSEQARVDLTLLARYLERFGDHATSLTSTIEYLVGDDASGRGDAAADHSTAIVSNGSADEQAADLASPEL